MDDAGRDALDAHLATVVADAMREVARLSEAALAAAGGGGRGGDGGGTAAAAASLGGWLRSTLGGAVGGGDGGGDAADGAVGEVAYRLGITALLSESLVALEAETAALRGLRVAAAAAKARGVSVSTGDAGGDAAIRRPAEEEAAWSAAHEQVLVNEHASLRSELLGTREAVRSTEAAVAEVAELNALLGARVAEQAAVIEGVLTAAVDASSSLRRGARELRKLEAGGGGWDVTLLFAAAFFVLALCLLWLHWLNR
ncbi:hypothetical protein I4F81_000990 [Pyropia yezoensis]|uniref:Uncharacterized protein n=1 Tax=Pyropia yezoensis TaxID=2788 RepID=A0ACC3BKB7_PYRYE|nr:hypothetical protein I4F81_000990 [Neopyropia yezoensis]